MNKKEIIPNKRIANKGLCIGAVITFVLFAVTILVLLIMHRYVLAGSLFVVFATMYAVFDNIFAFYQRDEFYFKSNALHMDRYFVSSPVCDEYTIYSVKRIKIKKNMIILYPNKVKKKSHGIVRNVKDKIRVFSTDAELLKMVNKIQIEE